MREPISADVLAKLRDADPDEHSVHSDGPHLEPVVNPDEIDLDDFHDPWS